MSLPPLRNNPATRQAFKPVKTDFFMMDGVAQRLRLRFPNNRPGFDSLPSRIFSNEKFDIAEIYQQRRCSESMQKLNSLSIPSSASYCQARTPINDIL